MWHDTETARNQWVTAINDDELADLLEVARMQVEAFAPRLPAGAEVPVNYRMAQLMQAKNLALAGSASPSGDFGQDGFSYTRYPMDNTVKAILRPKSGVPRVG